MVTGSINNYFPIPESRGAILFLKYLMYIQKRQL